MHPIVFKLPFVHWPVQSYGVMMVIGFLLAVWVIRRLSRDITPDPQLITNAALYSLIAGVVGARIFYVVHYFDKFSSDLLSVFAIWRGGLELLGGVILAITVIALYSRYHKLPTRQYLDILAIALMLALAFGRIGCFFKGCCFGKPTDVAWSVRFPYGSDSYYNQIYPDSKRGRVEPDLALPSDFFGYFDEAGSQYFGLKPYEYLTAEQKDMVDDGPYRPLSIHPTQLYSSAGGLAICFILYSFWKRSRAAAKRKDVKRLFTAPGSTFALMFILYSLNRFFMEFIRNDNPFEYAWWTIYKGGTVSQNLAIYMIIFGLIAMLILEKTKPKPANKGS